jgi:hypothetical protein
MTLCSLVGGYQHYGGDILPSPSMYLYMDAECFLKLRDLPTRLQCDSPEEIMYQGFCLTRGTLIWPEDIHRCLFQQQCGP